MKSSVLLLILSCFLLFGCEEVKYSHVEVYNSSDGNVSAKINEDWHTLKPKEKVKIASKTRAQLYVFGNEKQLVETKEDERFFINVNRDTIIRMELHDGKQASHGVEAQKTKIPYQIFKLNNRKYYLPAEYVSEELIIRNYDFSINEPAPSSLDSDSEEFINGSFLKDWTGYYKLYTVEELIASHRPLNNDRQFIQSVLDAGVMMLNPDYGISLNNEAVLVENKGSVIGDIGRARVSNDDVLELNNARVYNPEEHGAIKEVVGKIPKCNIISDTKTLNEDVFLDIVICEKTSNPRVVIK